MSRNDESHPVKDDALERYLTARGLPAAARRRGFAGLVTAWESVAREAARYDLTLDDWRNDLDLRDIISGAARLVTAREERETHDALERADALFRAATIDIGRPLWGTPEGATGGGEQHASWWYRRRPANPGQSMRVGLQAAGLLIAE